MNQLTTIAAAMTRYLSRASHLLLVVLMVTFPACDNEQLESSSVTFYGSISDVNYNPAANTKFEILIRTNPDIDPDTTVSVRLPLTTDEFGNYRTTVHTDGFPAVPFYTIEPVADTLMSLETASCLHRSRHQQIFLQQENHMSARFGAATFLKITFHRTQESNSTGIQMGLCNQIIATTLTRPDVTVTLRFPYDLIPNNYIIFYFVQFPDFPGETRNTEVTLFPYDTTNVVIDY